MRRGIKRHLGRGEPLTDQKSGMAFDQYLDGANAMLSIKHALPIAAMLLLVGCGSTYDCSSGDVINTVREALVDSLMDKKFKDQINDGVDISDIVTLGVDKDVDRYSCKATFSYTDPTGQTISQDMEYDVSQVESGDSAFEIAYDKTSFTVFGNYATRAEREKAAEEWNKENRRANRAALMARLKPLSREAATRELNEKFRLGENMPTIVPTQLDPERDDVEDYVVLWPWFGTPDGETTQRQAYMVTCVYQTWNGDDVPMHLLKGDARALPADVVPKNITVNGTDITITAQDGHPLEFYCVNASVADGHAATPSFGQ
jgi:hypothetical protein